MLRILRFQWAHIVRKNEPGTLKAPRQEGEFYGERREWRRILIGMSQGEHVQGAIIRTNTANKGQSSCNPD